MRRFRINQYRFVYRRTKSKSPFSENAFMNDIIILNEYDVEVIKIRISDPFMKGLYSMLIQLYSNDLPFYIEFPPTNSRETYSLSGEYEAAIGTYEFMITIAKKSIDEQLECIFLPLVDLEELDMIINEIEDNMDYSMFDEEELLDPENNIDRAYLYDHRFDRYMFSREHNLKAGF